MLPWRLNFPWRWIVRNWLHVIHRCCRPHRLFTGHGESRNKHVLFLQTNYFVVETACVLCEVRTEFICTEDTYISVFKGHDEARSNKRQTHGKLEIIWTICYSKLCKNRIAKMCKPGLCTYVVKNALFAYTFMFTSNKRTQCGHIHQHVIYMILIDQFRLNLILTIINNSTILCRHEINSVPGCGNIKETLLELWRAHSTLDATSYTMVQFRGINNIFQEYVRDFIYIRLLIPKKSWSLNQNTASLSIFYFYLMKCSQMKTR